MSPERFADFDRTHFENFGDDSFHALIVVIFEQIRKVVKYIDSMKFVVGSGMANEWR